MTTYTGTSTLDQVLIYFFIINILRTLRITAWRGHQLPPAPNGDLKGHILEILGAMTLHAIMPDEIARFSRELNGYLVE